jgi:hypothetical protein
MFRLSNWRPAHLLLSWCAYWIALPFLWLAPALPMLYRMSKPDQHGSANLSFGDQGFQFTIENAGRIVHQQSVSVLMVLMAIAVPPLVLWALWLRAQRREPERVASRQMRDDEHRSTGA